MVHGGGLALVVGSTGFGTKGVEGGVAGGDQQPAAEGFAGSDRAGFLCEGNEDGLCDILGEVGVVCLPAGGGPDEVDVTPDQLGERLVAAGGDEIF